MEGGGGAEGVTRVLLVDDSPVDRKVVELVLGSNTFAGSFHVIAVDSAKKAMEFLGLKDGKEQAVDMVLTDYCMPEMTGYDLLKAIKAMSPLKPIPVIVMSSENEPQRISRCLKAGAEDYIVKPLQSKDVPRLRSCSNAKPKEPPCITVSKNADHMAAVDGTTSLRRRAHLTDIAMVLHSSSAGLSHYFPFLFKFILLVYAILCVGELLHRWSNGCFLSYLR
ncbi:two-component response regulator ORR1-like [Hordeum vulgare subsp. vulgare]|uniref:Response regulatory domain-containing protein n=1 Tax=Hordeum vulgare subsp. vulgare TaxID=112509 RepID=A0A8I6XL34_HORVV|nr:two-component response regulator ORR1-like [Hordeum vulgare subsp. vulgare]KAI5015085.1 hypothetical protein ZWY2020_056475 [Hordeum vulgare]